MQLDILADNAEPDGRLGLPDFADHLAPLQQLRLEGTLQLQPLDHVIVEAGFLEQQRNVVEDVARHGRDHRAPADVAEERDLVDMLIRDGVIGARDDHIGLDADAAQLAHAVLGGLGLQLAAGADVGQEGDVDVERVFAPQIAAHLAQSFHKRQALDVADGAADFAEHHVSAGGLGHQANAALDFVGDVGNDLDRAAKIVAAPLARDHFGVDTAGRDVRHLVEVDVDEALVVAQVEVGLGPVFGDEHLAMLVGRHRARIDVDVGIELLHGDRQATGLEQPAQGSGRDAFAN